MKARSRQAPARPAVSRSLPPTPVAEVVAQDAAAPWEQWLDHLPTPQRHNLFVVKPACATATPRDAGGALLPPLVHALLAGRASGMPVAPPRVLPLLDVPATVARVLQSPDVFLWNRSPSQDVSAATADVVRQAVRLGLRVLILAAAPAPLDRILTRWAGDPTFLAVRFCGAGERASHGSLKRFSLDEQRSALRGRLLARVAEARADRDVRRARIHVEKEIWETLTSAVREIAALDARDLELTQRIAQLAAEVRREVDALTDDARAAAGPFASDFAITAKAYRERLEACERGLLPLRDRRDSSNQAMAVVAREQARIAPLLMSFRAGKWWTLSYWKARSNAELRQHALRTAEQEGLLSTEQSRLAAEIAKAEAEYRAVLEARDVDVRARVAAEVERRRAEIEQQINIVRRHRDEQVAKWKQTTDQLSQAEDRPSAPTAVAHELAHKRWFDRSQAEVALSGKEPDAQEVAADFLERMPFLAPVLVGTTLALARHADFATAADAPFDLVVLDDADRLAESELLAILAKAPRALAIGSAASAATSFGKLWRLLNRSEPPPTYQWSRLNEGYLCTLRPLTAADQPFVESERLADFPEIELRILSAPKLPPRLAQVVFPASVSAVQAKTFIYRELEEAAVDRVERPKKFVDTAERFTIAWECPESPTEESVDLEPGLREAICVKDGQLTTCHIEFDKSAGWNQAKIHDWLRRHIPTLDAPRTADLAR